MGGEINNTKNGIAICCGDNLAHVVAAEIAKTIAAAVAARTHAVVALAGGTTPADCYRLLAAQPLAWQSVHIIPTDERCVAESHPRCNRQMLAQTLMRSDGLATAANLLSLTESYHPPMFDLTLLGMGEDAHIASLFAPMPIAAANQCGVIRTVSPTAENRLSLTLPSLIHSRRILLLLTGDKKKQVLQNAPADSPLDKLLRTATVEIFCD